jgi:hypothetical protein
MKNRMAVAFFLLLLLSTHKCDSLVAGEDEPPTAGFEIKMSATFSNNGTAPWTLTEEETAVGLFMNTTWQTVHLIESSHPLEMPEIDEDGNAVALLRLPESTLQPREIVSYTLTYHAISHPRSLPDIDEAASGTVLEIPENLVEEYSRVEHNWLINDVKLDQLANNITSGETRVLKIVKSLVTWIRSNIKYETHERPLYANETFTRKEGDCDDQAILLITLCRILGIPAYLQVGCIYLPEATHLKETYWGGHVTVVSRRIGWHGWAIVYIPPWGWFPVDLTYVKEGLDDPLNSIKGAAVTMQGVIQYTNISRNDYVASHQRYQEFLQTYDLYIYEQDEMISLDVPDPWYDFAWRVFPLALAVTLISAIAVSAIGIVYLARRQKEDEPPQAQDCLNVA